MSSALPLLARALLPGLASDGSGRFTRKAQGDAPTSPLLSHVGALGSRVHHLARGRNRMTNRRGIVACISNCAFAASETAGQ